MKYIRHKKYGICLFPNIIKHKNMAECFFGKEEIISAGFVGIRPDGDLECYGSSESLRRISLEEDSEILRKQF